MINKGRFGTKRGPMLFGRDLQDAREEVFCRMVCDGLSLGVAFARAGFTSKAHNAPSNLFNLPRVQARAEAILEARRTTGVVSLGEVTDMLKRVFAGAHSAEEYSAAHNAAFSLARLYGHVTDKATLEVIRRPSRDPDAPSEQALSSWVNTLPALPSPGPEPLTFGPEPGPEPAPVVLEGEFSAFSRAPANPLGHDTQGPGPERLNDIKALEPLEHVDISRQAAGPEPGPEPRDWDFPSVINGLGGGPPGGRSENGAPTRPVTGTPSGRARTEVLGSSGPGPCTPGEEKGAPLNSLRVPVLTGEFPPAEDLF